MNVFFCFRSFFCFLFIFSSQSHRAIASGATTQDHVWGVHNTLKIPQLQMRKIDLYSFRCPNCLSVMVLVYSIQGMIHFVSIWIMDYLNISWDKDAISFAKNGYFFFVVVVTYYLVVYGDKHYSVAIVSSNHSDEKYNLLQYFNVWRKAYV